MLLKIKNKKAPWWSYTYLCNQCLSPLRFRVLYYPVHGQLYSTQPYEIKFVSDLRQVGGFLRVLRFLHQQKTDDQDITEILLLLKWQKWRSYNLTLLFLHRKHKEGVKRTTRKVLWRVMLLVTLVMTIYDLSNRRIMCCYLLKAVCCRQRLKEKLNLPCLSCYTITYHITWMHGLHQNSSERLGCAIKLESNS